MAINFAGMLRRNGIEYQIKRGNDIAGIIKGLPDGKGAIEVSVDADIQEKDYLTNPAGDTFEVESTRTEYFKGKAICKNLFCKQI